MKNKIQAAGGRVLYTNHRLPYSHSYSEMMNVNCKGVMSDHKIKDKHTHDFKREKMTKCILATE